VDVTFHVTTTHTIQQISHVVLSKYVISLVHRVQQTHQHQHVQHIMQDLLLVAYLQYMAQIIQKHHHQQVAMYRHVHAIHQTIPFVQLMKLNNNSLEVLHE